MMWFFTTIQSLFYTPAAPELMPVSGRNDSVIEDKNIRYAQYRSLGKILQHGTLLDSDSTAISNAFKAYKYKDKSVKSVQSSCKYS